MANEKLIEDQIKKAQKEVVEAKKDGVPADDYDLMTAKRRNKYEKLEVVGK